MAALIRFFQGCFVKAIVFYQYALSPLWGSSCRFYPSCSHYAKEALEKCGLFQGSFLSFKRIVKCHPWHPGGVDLVP